MNLRKATSSLWVAFIAAIMVGSIMAGCSQDEETILPRMTRATRDTSPIETATIQVGIGSHSHSKKGEYTKLNVDLNWTEGFVFRELTSIMTKLATVDSIKPYTGEIRRTTTKWVHTAWKYPVSDHLEETDELYPDMYPFYVNLRFEASSNTKIYFMTHDHALDSIVDVIRIDSTIQVPATKH